MIHIAIVEDEEQVRDQLSGYIKRYQEESDEAFEITTFSDGDQIVEDYRAVYDIIFLDIQMKRMDGMSAAERIREKDADVIIIFITNMSNYAIRGYAVDAMDYVLKPVPYFAFSQELKKAVSRLKLKVNDYLLLPVEDGVVRLEARQVSYIESVNRRLVVHAKEQEYTIYGTLKELEEKLGSQYFFRCNNCYLVNLAHVKNVRQNLVTVGAEQLQISRPRKKAFMNALADYVGGVIK